MKPNSTFMTGTKVSKFCKPCREEIAEERRLDREDARSVARTENRDRDGSGARLARYGDELRRDRLSDTGFDC